jgi:putative tricarboxylic transport membrane protein
VKRGWQVASLSFAALFAFAIWKASSLPLKDALGPGPGFFPLWLGILGGILALLLVLEVTRQHENGPSLAELMPDRDAKLRILAVLGLLALATFAFERLGFRLTSLAFTALLLPALGARSLMIGIPFVLAASFGVFHVFYHWLKVPLPIGMFGI